ncbi:Hypothetical predicted protein [Mytilus galloprovincialis]|uniref:Uncharacterized protein n=1 Tax=Mytilus galloprovincialis TaxID=29158 RepID=A0A8B6DQZ3_MYTGA|nr:Hypothetical predicted protein [Mytilus galloprovincialis]
MASMLYILSCLCFSSNAFLLDTNTPGQVGNLMTDNHYDYLLKLFMDERSARLQLQQYVVNQQQQITILSGLQARLEKVENATISMGQTSVTSGVDRKYEELEKKYEALQNNQMKLNDELNISKNRTRDLEKEVEILKQTKTINQLQTLSTLQQNVQSIQANLNSLISNSQARGQDIVSIHSEMRENKHKIQSLEHTTVKNISNLELSMNQKETVLEKKLYIVV